MPTSETYLADCMDKMREYPDKHFELAICDPPYGDLYDVYGRNRCDAKSGFSARFIKQRDDLQNWNIAPSEAYFNELLRVSKNQIIWGGNYFTNFLPPSSGWLIWDKGQRDFTFADGEMAWTSFNKAMRIWEFARAKNKSKIHPTQKPIDLYKYILTNYAKTSDKILDTHLGSGSSRIAAYELGFNFVGMEINEDYFNEQEKRFKNHIAQTILF
jgi:site-specific DNA-methyltransferase (adenine-specific)